jgi:ferredoxin-nitrite reductase
VGAALLVLGPLQTSGAENWSTLLYGVFLIVVGVLLAGGLAAIGRRLLRRIPTDDLVEVMENLVAAWLTSRAAQGTSQGISQGTPSDGATSFTFGDFCALHDDEQLVAIALGAPVDTPGDDVVAGVVVRIPGPLLEVVGGEDEITVAAATVGQALDQVTEKYPEFGTTVFEDGEISGAFLVAVGDDDIRGLDGLATAVPAGAEISLVMAMSGG